MLVRFEQPYRRMTRRVSTEQAAVRRDERAVAFEGKGEINGVPERHLAVNRQM
jgi:hypothetical protein